MAVVEELQQLFLLAEKCGRSGSRFAQKTADEPHFALGEEAAAVELPSVGGEQAVEFRASGNPGREAAHGHARGGIGEVGLCQVFSFHGGIRF